jgi:hypothetical protein
MIVVFFIQREKKFEIITGKQVKEWPPVSSSKLHNGFIAVFGICYKRP